MMIELTNLIRKLYATHPKITAAALANLVAQATPEGQLMEFYEAALVATVGETMVDFDGK